MSKEAGIVDLDGRGLDVIAADLFVSTRHRLGFGVAFLDVNNDGRLDLATANGHVDDFRPEIPYQMPAQLLVGLPGGKFVDATDASGTPWQVPQVARGLAAGDLDNDGRPDLLINAVDLKLAYFHNRTTGGHWLVLGLKGTKSRRDAVGARVVVTSEGRSISILAGRRGQLSVGFRPEAPHRPGKQRAGGAGRSDLPFRADRTVRAAPGRLGLSTLGGQGGGGAASGLPGTVGSQSLHWHSPA